MILLSPNVAYTTLIFQTLNRRDPRDSLNSHHLIGFILLMDILTS
jgi:hypothetical protein